MTTRAIGQSTKEMDPIQMSSQGGNSIGGINVGLDNINMVSETPLDDHLEKR
jgi:hypothetical protein